MLHKINEMKFQEITRIFINIHRGKFSNTLIHFCQHIQKHYSWRIAIKLLYERGKKLWPLGRNVWGSLLFQFIPPYINQSQKTGDGL